MKFLKQLVKGEFSLSFTFWNFLVLCSLLADQAVFFIAYMPSVNNYWIFGIAVSHVVKIVIACMSISALFFMIRNKKNTFWYIAAFIFSILNLIYLIYMVILCFPMIFYVAGMLFS